MKKIIKGNQKLNYVLNFAALADLNDARNKPMQSVEINLIGTIKT